MRPLTFAVSLLLMTSLARADEGMWTFDNFPSDRVAKAYGFAPDAAWLEHLRLSSARLGDGCSASLVSPRGLVMTNHHCIRDCVAQLSTKKADYLANGFVASKESDERRCPDVDASVLVEIRDVTERVNAATKGKTGAEFKRARDGEMARIEAECGTSADVRCDVVTLYAGGRYHLYRYARYDDVRLAFAPELQAPLFGGYSDNFNFPRYSFDVALLRLYRDGKPVETPQHLRWSASGAAEGELVFVSGHPGGTDRQLPVAELESRRDVDFPETLVTLSELRGTLMALAHRSPELEQQSRSLRRTIDNAQKAYVGYQRALANPAFFAERRAAEAALREKLRRDVPDGASLDRAFDEIAAALRLYRPLRPELRLCELAGPGAGELYGLARELVRYAEERTKPNPERLREYTDARLPALEQAVTGDRPFTLEVEKAQLLYWLTRARDTLGPDHAFVKAALEGKPPEAVVEDVFRDTQMAKASFRTALLRGGKPAVDASKDPMISLARRVDPIARAVRRRYEGEVQSVLLRNGELVARAHVAVEGMGSYPDATGTLRLSYGQVKGWRDGATQVPAFTTFGGAFERSTGQPPYALPPSWVRAKSKVDPATPFDLVTTNDIIGGNSGSPLVNVRAEVVGLVFDGNLPSLAGRYFYDVADNRTVAVDSRGILEALGKIYGATRLRAELTAP